ncbi:MAG TPA: ribonuclease P protein component [Bacteroidales bacterium]|nr:ribonuclease P protein component [Bacteroidales bacterium]HPE55469.1 ribonuclease P protein component [Bacteroidales bacterium]HRX96991.1 ribonuclease P protein component [Bacteroidales bacterium]
MQSQSFKKDQRLSSQKIIDQLFTKGQRFLLFPFLIVWLPVELNANSPVQVLISVSKKKFKKAVDRNLAKRRIREAYRKNNGHLLEFMDQKQNQLALGIIYTGVEILAYKEIEKKILLVLQRLQMEYEKTVR